MSTDAEPEEKTCRICFASDLENDSLGSLFSPCKCSGSMKYVHVGNVLFSAKYLECLNEWRRVSQKTDKLQLQKSLSVKLVVYLYFSDEDFLDDDLNYEYIRGPEDILWSYIIPSRKSIWKIDLSHFVGGLVGIGFMGAIQLIVTFFTGPVGFLTRIGLGGRRGNTDRFNAILFLALLSIGVGRALWSVYLFVRSWSKKRLLIILQPGMGHDVYNEFKMAKEVIDEAEEAVGGGLRKLMFEGPQSLLTSTEIAQPAILAHS
ncbi:hypothetical protein HK096_004795, partial [Nowakowskiella sp. JEL0078]